jgi:hypothetical protein
MSEFFPVFVFLCISTLLSLLILGLSFVFFVQKPDPEKLSGFFVLVTRGLLMKILFGSFGVDVPSEYVFGEGSDQEEEGEPEGSPTAPRTVEEQVREISPERWDRLFRAQNPFETPNPRLWAERDREAAAVAAVHEWAHNRGDPSLASLFLQPGSSQAEAAAAVLERALRNEGVNFCRGEPSGSHEEQVQWILRDMRDRGSASEASAALRGRGEPSGSHQVLEPESSQASSSRGTTGTSGTRQEVPVVPVPPQEEPLPTTPEKPTNPRKRAREDSDEEEV